MARIVCLGSALQDVYMKDRDDLTEREVAGRNFFDKLGRRWISTG